MSLSDDHFDQYTIRRLQQQEGGKNSVAFKDILPLKQKGCEANVIGAEVFDNNAGSRFRRNRPSLIRQFEVNDTAVRMFF